MKKERLTLEEAQAVWDNIEQNIKIAPFNDEGFALPHIDMAKIFGDRKSMSWQKITEAIQNIINKWDPE
jgi:hypothetical protein